MCFEPLLTSDVWWLVVNKRRRRRKKTTKIIRLQPMLRYYFFLQNTKERVRGNYFHFKELHKTFSLDIPIGRIISIIHIVENASLHTI